MKKLIFLLPVVSLTILLSGCQNSGNENGYDTGNNESEISQDAQVNAPVIDIVDTEEVSLVNETETICEKTAVNLGEEESGSQIIVQRNVQEMEMDPTVYLTAIIGEIEGELDSGPIAKVALFIIENLN